MAITNTRGIIATAFPSDTNEVQLYSVPAGTSIDGVLRISNQNTAQSSYYIAQCPAGHGDNPAANTDWIATGVYIGAIGNAPHEYSIHAGPTETIRIKAGTASVLTFHFSGNKEVVS